MKEESYKLGGFAQGSGASRWATPDEIKNDSTFIRLNSNVYPGAGLPLLSNGETAYVDNSDTHTLIFGATGSKKTRLFCMPMSNIFARAGESFSVTDPKGELYSRSSGIVKENGYETVVLNFRDIGHGDMWNPLAIPYELYHSGDQERAIAILNDFVSCIVAPFVAKTNDAFWPQMGSAYALACLIMLMECADKSEVNVLSLSAMCSNDVVDSIKGLANSMPADSIASLNLKAVLSAPYDTQMCIFGMLFSMVRIFITQRNLSAMLSGNTIDISSFGKRKTAVYIIVPDEKTTYHFLVTVFIKQVYETLVAEAQKSPDRKLPVRVNFLLDEFCNLPQIPDMPSMISASRSRNMRFFLVVQSLHQLKDKYHENADTIKGNCDNWVFLTSRELALLEEISQLCGNTGRGGKDSFERPLISVSELQRLDKQKGEALIMHSRRYPIITEIADIDDYSTFSGRKEIVMKKFAIPTPAVFSISKFWEDVQARKRKIPFTDKYYPRNRKSGKDSGKDSGFPPFNIDDWF